MWAVRKSIVIVSFNKKRQAYKNLRNFFKKGSWYQKQQTPHRDIRIFRPLTILDTIPCAKKFASPQFSQLCLFIGLRLGFWGRG